MVPSHPTVTNSLQITSTKNFLVQLSNVALPSSLQAPNNLEFDYKKDTLPTAYYCWWKQKYPCWDCLRNRVSHTEDFGICISPWPGNAQTSPWLRVIIYFCQEIYQTKRHLSYCIRSKINQWRCTKMDDRVSDRLWKIIFWVLGIDVNKTTFVKDRECCCFEDDESKDTSFSCTKYLKKF